jgi:hypothetical protein
MKRSFALFFAFPVVAFMVSLASARTYDYDRVIDKAFDASGLKRVSIHAEGMRVEGWEVDSVEVYAEYHVEIKGWYWGGSESYDVEIEKSGQTLVIREIEEEHGIFGIMMTRRAHNEFIVRMPKRLAAEIRGEDGRIQLQDLSGPVRVEFEDGRLEARNLSSPDLRIHFEDGSAELSEIRGALEVEFEDGSLQVRESDLSALRLSFSDGRVELESSVSGEGPYRVTLDDGRFEWTFPCSTAATFEAKVEDGGITADFPSLSKTSYRHEFYHTLGIGGPLVEIDAQDGSIVLETGLETKKQTE